MSMELATTHKIVGRSLDELASDIRTEFRLANESASSAVEHAIRCGDALIEARQSVPLGSWTKWLATNTSIEHSTACYWMNLARYRDHIPEGAGIATARDAVAAVARAVGTSEAHQRPRRHPEWMVDEARRLHAEEGLSCVKIGALLGVAHQTVRLWLDDDVAAARRVRRVELQKRRRAAEAALRAKEKHEAARRVTESAGTSVVYSTIRKALAANVAAIEAASSPEERERLRAAERALHRAEDAVVEAAKLRTQD